MAPTALIFILVLISVAGAGFLYWRHIWFFRNPSRIPPPGANIVSPADGTVVYVKTVEPKENVIVIKHGSPAGRRFPKDPDWCLHEPFQCSLQSGAHGRDNRANNASSAQDRQPPHGPHALSGFV